MVYPRRSHASGRWGRHTDGLCTLVPWGQETPAASVCDLEAVGWKQKEAEPLNIMTFLLVNPDHGRNTKNRNSE